MKTVNREKAESDYADLKRSNLTFWCSLQPSADWCYQVISFVKAAGACQAIPGPFTDRTCIFSTVQCLQFFPIVKCVHVVR